MTGIYCGAGFDGALTRIMLIDLRVEEIVSGFRTAWLDAIFRKLTILGSPWLLLLAGGLLALYWLRYGKRSEAILFSLLLISNWIMVNYLKIAFGRSRPNGEALSTALGYSLPSGHASLSLCFYGFLAFLFIKKHQDGKGKTGVTISGVLILLVGASRVYLNVHYLSDVLAGYLLGAVWLQLFVRMNLAFNRWVMR